jgi:hypothetical protein
MRFISLRQFQRHCYEELKHVPFVLTRQDKSTLEKKPVFIVLPYSEYMLERVQPPKLEVTATDIDVGTTPDKKNDSLITRIFGKK